MKNDLSSQHQDVIIRQMRDGDIDLLVANFCFPWSTLELTRELWQGYYKEQLGDIRTVGILEKRGQILGYGSLFRKCEYPHFANIPEVNNVWIDAGHRGVGLGSKLIGYLESLAKKEGYKQIGLGVGLYKDYGPAQKLYFELGYAPDGHGITYKNQPVIPGDKYYVDDELILWLVKSI